VAAPPDSCACRVMRCRRVLIFAQTIINISGESARSNEALANLKLALQGVDAIEDVLELKLRLRDCLKTVCDEATRQKSESDAVLLELHSGAARHRSDHRVTVGIGRSACICLGP